MKRPSVTLYSLVPWSIAACGFLILAGNLAGLTNLQIPIFPVVKDPVGLLINSVFFAATGFVPVALANLFTKAR